jgi:hypothetical protein
LNCFSGEAITLADWIASLPPTRSALRRVARNDERQKQTGKTRKEKGKRNADKRSLISVLRATPADVATGLRFGRGSPVGVPPRLWLRRPNATAQLQHRAS